MIQRATTEQNCSIWHISGWNCINLNSYLELRCGPQDCALKSRTFWHIIICTMQSRHDCLSVNKASKSLRLRSFPQKWTTPFLIRLLYVDKEDDNDRFQSVILHQNLSPHSWHWSQAKLDSVLFLFLFLSTSRHFGRGVAGQWPWLTQILWGSTQPKYNKNFTANSCF